MNKEQLLEKVETLPKDEVQWLVYQLMMHKKLSFEDLASLRVTVLEDLQKANSEQITDLAFISSMYREPKLNGGTKISLERRYAKAILKSAVFAGTPFEQELKEIAEPS